jgi:hypothetical protein
MSTILLAAWTLFRYGHGLYLDNFRLVLEWDHAGVLLILSAYQSARGRVKRLRFLHPLLLPSPISPSLSHGLDFEYNFHYV